MCFLCGKGWERVVSRRAVWIELLGSTGSHKHTPLRLRLRLCGAEAEAVRLR